MAFLSASPTPVPEYVGEVQAVGDASSAAGSFDLPTPETEPKPKTKPQEEMQPQEQTQPAYAPATEPATSPATSPASQPAPFGVPLPGTQPARQPAWQPAPTPAPVPVRNPAENPFAPPSVKNGLAPSPLKAPLASNITPKASLGDIVKERLTPVNTEKVNYSILNGGEQSAQNLQNALHTITGHDYGKDFSNAVVTGTRVLGAVEAIPEAIVTTLAAPALVAEGTAALSKYGEKAFDTAYMYGEKAVSNAATTLDDLINNAKSGLAFR